MSKPQQVFTRDGHRGVIIGEADVTGDAPRYVAVQMDDGARLHVPAELLEPRPDGAYTLLVGMADIEGRPSSAAAADGADPSPDASRPRRLVVPVVVEELEVGRRTVTTGVVRVQKHVHEHEQLVEEPVTREDVRVERVPVGRMVETPPAMRSEGDTLIIPVLEEVLVVEKRLRLKEELRVTWGRVVEQSSERVVLRVEEVVVDRLPAAKADSAGPKAR